MSVKNIYIRSYILNKQIQASISLLHSHALSNSTDVNLTCFAVVFSRLADRALYHSTNVYEKFEITLSSNEHSFDMLENDEVSLFTSDTSSKYEIEAYLGAAKCLFEDNFIGIDKKNRSNLLGNVFVEDLASKSALINEFKLHKELFFKNANKIRNNSFHVNKELNDIGVSTLIKRSDNKYSATIPNVHQNADGSPLDLYDLFIATELEINNLITQVRDILINHYLNRYPPPPNTYLGIVTKYENAIVELSKNGFKFLNYKDGEQISY
jgi:hypothetical protein